MNCTRAGCTGEIQDGYCDRCGMAPAPLDADPTGASGPEPISAPSRRVAPGFSGSSLSSALVSQRSGAIATKRTSSARSASRGNLGAGLVDVPAVPYRDPGSVVLTNPEVPEHKRYCTAGHPVGRARDGSPGRQEGFCPICGTRFSFTAKLGPGDLVAGQYDVVGCIAHGGLGWVYLARDRNVSDRWVVLKGLLDSGDESAMAAAIAERRFLAQVEHPNIVRIYNFVEHDGAGYIVMEYVGGQSLKELRQAGPGGAGGPLPVSRALAYILEILPALGFLHSRDLLFCDFKPDNVIQTEEQLKLIDLGGVRHLDDDQSDLYGTIGYQAPEVADLGPSVTSDLYTVARTLAVLTFDFAGYQDGRRYATCLPPATDVEVFARYPSFHWFLARATHVDPDRRFQSATEMADQLVGVLREVVATDGGRPRSAPSTLFTGELLADVHRPAWRDLPAPQVDPADAGAPTVATLATLAAAQPDQVVAALETAPPTTEVLLALTRARLEIGDLAGAEHALDRLDADVGGEWRITWWRGVAQLVAGVPDEAETIFRELARELPGELAPKLAMAMASELRAADASAHDASGVAGAGLDALHVAGRWYDVVSRTDPAWAGAAFGLARVRLAQGDRAGAADALRRVPADSIHSTAAQLALCDALSLELNGAGPTLDDLVTASDALAHLHTDNPTRLGISRQLLTSALMLLDERTATDEPTTLVAGAPFTDRDLRLALEQTCRSLARSAGSDAERFALVDEANAHRPRTLV